MKVALVREAKRDLVDVYRFYERQEIGLGARFLEALEADLATLEIFAGIHPRALGYPDC